MKKALIFLSTFIMIAVIAVCVAIQDRESIDSVKFTVPADGGASQDIWLYCENGKHYAFLPSYADFGTLKVSCNAASLYIDGKLFNNESSFADFAVDREYSLEIKNRLGVSVCQSKLVFMQGGAIPSLSVKLVDGTINEINENKELSRSGRLTVINPDGTVDYNGSLRRMHGRGNSTWSQAKKPYALEFSKDVELLGMGAGKNWVLLANSFDESGLRNKLAYDTAKELGVEYSVSSEFVDLYVNNEYLGLYLLTEKVEVGKNRVDIDDLAERTQSINYKSLSGYDQYKVIDAGRIKKGFNIPNEPEDVSGGYLVQIENHADTVATENNLFQTDTLSFTVSYPKCAGKKEIDYVFSLFNRAEQALKEGDYSYIDLESFVKYYLIQEFFANVDTSSAFCYKDIDSVDSKIHACSIWDLDLTLGNSWNSSDMPPEILSQSISNWYPYLYNIPEFRDMLRECYTSFFGSDPNAFVSDKLQLYKSRMESSFDMNKVRWKSHENDGTSSSKSQNRFDTLYGHINYINNYMNERTKALDSVWVDGTEYNYVYFYSFETSMFKKWYAVKAGEVMGEAPVPPAETAPGQTFAGWFDAQGNEYVPGRELTQSERYTARWKPAGGSAAVESSPLRRIASALKRRAQIFLYGDNKYLIIGLGIICCAIVGFIAVDIKRTIRSRRCGNGRKR